MVAVLAVDVGTGSARCALVDDAGRVLARAVEATETHTYHHVASEHEVAQEHFVQSTDNIWHAICAATSAAMAQAGLTAEDVVGVAFDATCSLAVVDAAGEPVPVLPDDSSGEGAESPAEGKKARRDNGGGGAHPTWNVILWMDHRATREAADINATRHMVLDYVGGKISPEMEMPKILWLKRHAWCSCYSRAAHFFDLPDFLTYRATGSTERSLCSLVCKCTYLHGCSEDGDTASNGWQADFLAAIGLGDLAQRKGDVPPFACIGTRALPPGHAVGKGLTAKAAAELGLRRGTAVATGSIDAHAGVLGVVGEGECDTHPLYQRLSLVLGTSSCHMALSRRPLRVSGVWGPYNSVVLDGWWLNEGGQSASGALVDHIINSHAAAATARAHAKEGQTSIYEWLNQRAVALAQERGLRSVWHLSQHLHVLPFFHGNRAPLADPSLRGMISGLHLATDPLDDLTKVYISTLVALSLETRHIMQAMEESGHDLRTIHVCGGLCKNKLYLQAHADATQRPVFVPSEDAVLVGTAVLAATAARQFTSVHEAMAAMSKCEYVLHPQEGHAPFFERKFAVYKRMCTDITAYKAIMAGQEDVHG